MASFFGKYRGTVINNQDPEQRARVQVKVPDVLGAEPSAERFRACPSRDIRLAFTSFPPSATKSGLKFEHGDPRNPICVGACGPPLAIFLGDDRRPAITEGDRQNDPRTQDCDLGCCRKRRRHTLSIPGVHPLAQWQDHHSRQRAGARIVLQGSTVSSSNPPTGGRHPLIP